MVAAVKVYRNGITGGVPGPGSAAKDRAPRGEVRGWSVASSRANTRFLFGVRAECLDGQGWVVTLTVRECPDAARWARAREAWLARIVRLGAKRVHWVVEWHERRAPHLHAAVWFGGDPVMGEAWSDRDVSIWGGWCDVVRRLGMVAADCSQHTGPIKDALGWLQYLAKHAARGAGHYQRAAQGIPEGWMRTGRMWGHLGDWPIDDPVEVDLDWRGWYLYRRLVRRHRIAIARALPRPARSITAARRMLRWTHRESAAYRGVSGWVPQDIVWRMLDQVVRAGGKVYT